METASSSLFETGVWLIPLILIATIAGLYMLVRRWQEQTRADLKQLHSDLRYLHTSRRQIMLAVQVHSVEDPEPYGSRVAALNTQLAQSEAQLGELQGLWVDLQEQAHWLASNRWKALIGAPYFWWSLRHDVTDLWERMLQAQKALETAMEAEHALGRVGLEVARHARDVQQLHQQAAQIVEALRSKGMYGSGMETAIQQEKQARVVLAQAPSYFLTGDETTILEHADKENTTATHLALENTQREMEGLLTQANTWDHQYTEISERIALMQRVLGSVEQLLVGVPNELDVGAQRSQFGQLKIIAQTLQATLGRLEIESMSSVAQETVRVTKTAQEIETQVKQARQQLTDLEKVLAELNGGLKHVSAQCAVLGTRPPQPIVWSQTTITLTDLNRQASAIGGAKKPRDPLQIDQDLVRARQLNEQQKTLAQYCQQAEQEHTELLALLNSPEMSQINAWVQNGQQLAARVKEYAPENWSRMDAVGSLAGELQDLSKDLPRLIPSGGPRPLQESELSLRLSETRQLNENYQKMKKRVENIRSRLADLQNEEKQSQEQLAGVQAAITQVAFTVRSNPFLSGIANQDLGRMQHELQGLLNDLSQRQRGSLEKKAKQASALTAKVEQTSNRWLDQLNQDTATAMKSLSGALTALDAIAPLEDAPVDDARRLLSSGQAFGVSSYAGKSRFRLAEIVAEFKKRSDYWQSCAAAAQKLEDLAGPVIDTYNQANENRIQTQEAFSQVASWIRQARDWPPTSVNIDAERQELDKVEGQWQALRTEPTRALPLVQQIGNLSAHYQTLVEKIRQSADRASQEMSQVEDLENEIGDMAQNWHNNSQAYRDEPDIAQEIRNLLDEVDRELAQIKRQYKQKARNYAQTLQSLKLLDRKLRYFQVALDPDHAIDVTGNVNRRR